MSEMCAKCPNWNSGKTQEIPQNLESSVFTLAADFMSAALVNVNSSIGIFQDYIHVVKNILVAFRIFRTI